MSKNSRAWKYSVWSTKIRFVFRCLSDVSEEEVISEKYDNPVPIYRNSNFLLQKAVGVHCSYFFTNFLGPNLLLNGTDSSKQEP